MANPRSDVAAHYIGMHRFSTIVGVSYDTFRRWLLAGPVWVPTPAVKVASRPGWEEPVALAWAPGVDPYTRADPVEYMGVTAMLHRHRLTRYDQLWSFIASGHIPTPDVWIDNERPGWKLPKP